MKRYISVINRHQYLYTSDTIYINKGKTLTKNKCLGAVGAVAEEQLRLKEELFRQNLLEAEAKARINYWTARVQNKLSFNTDTLHSLEVLRSELYRKKKSLGPLADSLFEMAFLIDFIYNSNRMEGSRLGRKEVQRLLETTSRSNNEVMNTSKAKEYLDKLPKLALKGMESLQRLLMAHEPTKQGFRRFDDIIVGNEPVDCPASQIKPRLKELLQWYQHNEFVMYPPEMAFEFYRRFELIHPFEDGNGRTGRLLMNHILKRARYHPLIIWNSNQESHKNAFSKSRESPRAFMDFMIVQYKKTYAIYLEKVSDAMKQANSLQSFLSPTS